MQEFFVEHPNASEERLSQESIFVIESLFLVSLKISSLNAFKWSSLTDYSKTKSHLFAYLETYLNETTATQCPKRLIHFEVSLDSSGHPNIEQEIYSQPVQFEANVD